ncbi:unnamed protein product, partial [Adineta steineri]
MPKVTRGKGNKKPASIEEEEEPIITVVDKTVNKGIKRKASSSVGKNVKKVSSINEEATTGTTQEVEDEEIQLPRTMTLKTSDRLSTKGEKATLKLASWNLNGIRAWLKGDGLKYIEQEQPDMICFQELKCDKEKIPNEATPTGYKSYWLSGDT